MKPKPSKRLGYTQARACEYKEGSESSVTWNNRPSASGGRLAGYGPVAKRSWIAYDVEAAIDGDGYVAFVIKGTSSDAVSFYSRQNGSNQPRLVVWSSAPESAEEPGTETPVVEASRKRMMSAVPTA